jgi:glucan phosphoethanolaminetransferase (alkaline phosphatase superfamily)
VVTRFVFLFSSGSVLFSSVVTLVVVCLSIFSCFVLERVFDGVFPCFVFCSRDFCVGARDGVERDRMVEH